MMSSFSLVPICGYVSAGPPEEAAEAPLGYVMIPLPHTGGDLFGLVVRGQSMRGLGIEEGQVVLLRRQETFADGDVVVALLDGEATLKRIYRHADGYLLEPENPDYAALFVTSQAIWYEGEEPRSAATDVRILGLMVGMLSESVFPILPAN